MNLSYLRNKKRQLFENGFTGGWDIFVSAYSDSERLSSTFERVTAQEKHWVILPEYGIDEEVKLRLGNSVDMSAATDEAEVILGIFSALDLLRKKEKRICFDITGFLRPHIMFLAKYLVEMQFAFLDVIYTEPEKYTRKENTSFSADDFEAVRQVNGFEGSHIDETSGDILIIGVGYDDSLISHIVTSKEGASPQLLLSLPSLSADMYQESILRLARSSTAFESTLDSRVFFAPANDPFVVATELSDRVEELRTHRAVTNIYLSPLATKPQALGFAIYYLKELTSEPASIIFPFTRHYNGNTSVGAGRTWNYVVGLP